MKDISAHCWGRVLVILTLIYFTSCNQSQPSETQKKHENHTFLTMKTPQSIKTEHTELHHQLEMATKLPGQTGLYAKEVAHLLHPHFIKEEKFALPPLTLLPQLSQGNISNEMKDYIPLCDTLKKDWSIMLGEHKQIKQKLDLLQKAAEAEGQETVVRFVEGLRLHAQTEEELLYPAAILVGDYLKMKFETQ